jgi:hypothetical protein
MNELGDHHLPSSFGRGDGFGRPAVVSCPRFPVALPEFMHQQQYGLAFSTGFID